MTNFIIGILTRLVTLSSVMLSFLGGSFKCKSYAIVSDYRLMAPVFKFLL